MKITGEIVKKIAALSRIGLSESEIQEFTGQLGKIVDYMDKLDELDTSGVPPTSHAAAMNNVLRADEPEEPLPLKKALGNAPDRHGDYFKVPGIIDYEP